MDYRDKLDLRLIQRRKLENTFSAPSARNMGILEAKYDYIIGLDSDVICNEYFLENMYKFLSSRDPSAMSRSSRTIGKSGRPSKVTIKSMTARH